MNSKITKQDVKLGRIFRCGNCDAKCGDDLAFTKGKYECGRVKELDGYTYSCSRDCFYKQLRDGARGDFEKMKQDITKNLPEKLECLKWATLKNDIAKNQIFKIVKLYKMKVKLLTKLLNRQMTLAEIQAGFFDVSRLSMEVAESHLEIFPENEKTYMFWVNSSVYMNEYVKGDELSAAWSIDEC